MLLPESFFIVLDLYFQTDHSPYADPGHRSAVPLPGLPAWRIQPHEASEGQVHFCLYSPELAGENGLVELLAVLDFIHETGPADAVLSSMAVCVRSEPPRTFQVEMMGQVFDRYQPVLSSFHGENVLERGTAFTHDFSRLHLTGLPLTYSTEVNFGAALIGLGLLQYGMESENPSLPEPATSRHQALRHLVNELEVTQEVRDEIIPAIKNRVLVAGMMLGELSLRRAKQLRSQVDF